MTRQATQQEELEASYQEKENMKVTQETWWLRSPVQPLPLSPQACRATAATVSILGDILAMAARRLSQPSPVVASLLLLVLLLLQGGAPLAVPAQFGL